MKILSVSPYPVYPAAFGGQLRIFNLARGLAKAGNDVTLAYNFTNWGERIEGVREGVNLRSFKTYFQDVGAWLHQRKLAPLIVTEPFNTAIGSAFRKMLNGYDVVIFEQPFLASWMKQIESPTVKIYDSHNIEVDFESLFNSEYRFEGLYNRMLERCERRAINLSDVVIAVSQEDKEKMGLLYHRTDNVHVVPNGYNGGREYNKAGLRNLEGIPLEKRVAVFIGSQTPPNEAAAKRVLDIASQDPNTLYLLVGECSEGLKTDRKNVRLVGQVEDADKYLSMADVGLLPVLEGSGSNVKLLHYLSRGLSVVTTPFGLRGYAPLKNYVSVGQVEEFRDMIGEAGTKKVQPKLIEVYKWDNLALRLDEIIRRAVNGTN